MDTEQYLTTREGGARAYLRRHLARLRTARAQDDRGSVMIESLVAIMVVGLAMAGFTSTSIAVNKGQRHAQAHDVATQVAHGLLEKAKATPWNRLGYAPTQPSLNKVVLKAGGQVLLPSPATTPEWLTDLPGDPVVTVDNINVTVVVSVRWKPGQGSGTAEKPGTKVVTVLAEWPVPGDDDIQSATYTLTRTARAVEAAPTGLPEASS
ncbi:type IV pilus modification PilV family protein [Nocardioides pakistanensis]